MRFVRIRSGRPQFSLEKHSSFRFPFKLNADRRNRFLNSEKHTFSSASILLSRPPLPIHKGAYSLQAPLLFSTEGQIMSKTVLRAGIAIVVVGTILSISLAQVREPIQKTPKSDSGAALRAKSILGSKVHLQGNATAGTVEDIVFDEEGVIDYFIVSDGTKMVTVPWEAAKFNFEKRTAVINITQEQYQQIPTYTTERYPDFYTPAYRTQVYKYYGLTPGQERRFERRLFKK